MGFDFRRLDVYRKVPKDLTQPTLTGAIVSMCCCVFILYLFLSELYGYLTVDVVSELYVANPDREGRIPVRINVTTPWMACEYLGLDIQDEMGRHEVGFVEDVVKTPTADAQGCTFEALFHINKVPGNFHLSTHSARKQPQNPDFRHVVHSVRFGDNLQHKNTPGSFNPLEGRDTSNSNGQYSHDYILKVVPSVYEELGGDKMYSYQYTYAHKEYTSYHHSGQVIPAVWFRYDLSPITVKYMERREPFYSFLTSICAIIGGTFTVAGIIDSFIFTASEFYKKLELGKLS